MKIFFYFLFLSQIFGYDVEKNFRYKNKQQINKQILSYESLKTIKDNIDEIKKKKNLTELDKKALLNESFSLYIKSINNKDSLLFLEKVFEKLKASNEYEIYLKKIKVAIEEKNKKIENFSYAKNIASATLFGVSVLFIYSIFNEENKESKKNKKTQDDDQVILDNSYELKEKDNNNHLGLNNNNFQLGFINRKGNSTNFDLNNNKVFINVGNQNKNIENEELSFEKLIETIFESLNGKLSLKTEIFLKQIATPCEINIFDQFGFFFRKRRIQSEINFIDENIKAMQLQLEMNDENNFNQQINQVQNYKEIYENTIQYLEIKKTFLEELKKESFFKDFKYKPYLFSATTVFLVILYKQYKKYKDKNLELKKNFVLKNK